MHNAGYLREEPGAGKPLARICEGESRMAELLDHDPPRARSSAAARLESHISGMPFLGGSAIGYPEASISWRHVVGDNSALHSQNSPKLKGRQQK